MLLKVYGHPIDEKKYKGWSDGFVNKFARGLYEQLIKYFGMGDQECQSYILKGFEAVANYEKMVNLISEEHAQIIIYKGILPTTQRT